MKLFHALGIAHYVSTRMIFFEPVHSCKMALNDIRASFRVSTEGTLTDRFAEKENSTHIYMKTTLSNVLV